MESLSLRNAHYPLSALTALPRLGSDHTPPILDTGARTVTSQKSFHFEKWWLDLPDFKNLVCNVCNSTPSVGSAIDN